MKNPEDKIIKAYYHSKRLSNDQIEQILNSTAKDKKSGGSVHIFMKYAAAFILLLGISYTVFYLPIQKQNVILEGFATEIAFNHTKNLPPEFLTANLTELKENLDQLDFDLRFPDKYFTDKQVIGARYCSVDNRIAAQLKLLGPEGKPETCYIFKKQEKFDFDREIDRGKTHVMLWHSDDLIFAIAKGK